MTKLIHFHITKTDWYNKENFRNKDLHTLHSQWRETDSSNRCSHLRFSEVTREGAISFLLTAENGCECMPNDSIFKLTGYPWICFYCRIPELVLNEIMDHKSGFAWAAVGKLLWISALWSPAPPTFVTFRKCYVLCSIHAICVSSSIHLYIHTHFFPQEK